MYIQVADYTPNDPADIESAMVVKVDDRSVKIAVFGLGGTRPGLNLDKVIDQASAQDVFVDSSIDLYRCQNGEVIALQGFTEFSFGDIMGLDEVVDYSIIDLYARCGEPQPWTSRLASTRAEKILYSARYRNVEQFAQLGSIYIPFATGDMNDCIVHLVRQGELSCNLPVTYEFNGLAFPIGPGGALWMKHFWHADLSVESITPNCYTLKAKLFWNETNVPCTKKTELFISSDAGYLPRSVVTTDENGEAIFKLMPIGLNPLERIKVKVSAMHFSKLGSLEVIVP